MTQKRDIILNTKLQKPFLPDDFISRERVLKYLNEDINHPLTLISAGAGFGKSTFVSSWLDTIGFKNCWFSIDEQDNDIRVFLTYFIASVQTVMPNFGNNIYRNIFSPNIHSLNTLTNNLINDLSSLEEDIFLVLDDFQNINNLDITNLISNILKYPPKKFHIVIISRIDPPLPIHKLRAANKMKDIRSSDLRLSEEESKIFLQNSINIKNNEQIISLINNKFEGWITGIRLLKIQLSYANFDVSKLENIIQNSNLTENYFVEELIKQIDKKTLQFLLQTSVFQKINSGLSDFVLSTKNKQFNSKNIINELLNKNLFLINLDNTNQWFRYHHLFQDALQEELKKTYIGQDINNIHRKAAKWFIEKNSYEEAFYHIIQIRDTEEVADFVRANLYMPLNVNKWFVLEKWLKHIPDSNINKCPVLLVAQMWIMHHKGAYWIIPKLINKVEEIKNNNIELYNGIKHQLVFFKAIINFWSANIDKSIEQFYYVKNNIQFDKLGAISLSTIYYAVASQMAGNGAKVFKEIQLEISRNNLPADYKIILLASLVYINFLEGDLYTAERITGRIAKLSRDLDNDFYVVWYEFFMGYITFQQYRIEEALSHFKKALDLVYLLNTHAPVDAFAGVLIILKFINKNKEFEKINNELTSFVYEWNNPVYNTIAYSLKARLSIIDNDLQKASEEYKKADMFFDTETIIFNIEVPRITYCKLLLAENSTQKTDEAISKLVDIQNYVTTTHNTPQTIDTLILLSVAYLKKDNLLKAIENISKAIILAEKGNYIFPFIEQAEFIMPVLHKVKTKDGNIKNFISKVLDIAFRINGSIKKQPAFFLGNKSTTQNLSNRELDVVALLAQRLSNKEIAEQLFISPLTVKKHTIIIYQKLGVNKRSDAVRVAEQMGIITS